MSIRDKIFKMVELAMPKDRLGDAKAKAANRWEPLNEHLLKVAVWGISPAWKTELRVFVANIQDIRLGLKLRSFLTFEEHREQGDLYSLTKNYERFEDLVSFWELRMKQKKRKRSTWDAYHLMINLQDEIAKALSKGEADRSFVDKLIKNL